MSYGTRYLELRGFIAYCRKLNITTDEQELEYYEKESLMLPTARTVLPEEYIKRSVSWRLGRSSEVPRPEEWPGLDELSDRQLVFPQDYAQLDDKELIDSFDHALEHNNSYIIRPEKSNFRPWHSYEIVIEYENGLHTGESTATHYYSYWQAYQLYEIQRFPDLYKNWHLIDRLPEGFREKWWLPRAYNPEVYRSFKGKGRFFDTLSFYISMCNREEGRTFALIPEQHQIKRLNAQQLQDYQKRLSAHAKFVVQRHSLTEQELHKFLVDLLDLRHEYRNAERLKLADELANDIIYQARLVAGATGKEWDDIAEELGKIAPFWIKREFRHIDPVTKERDDAHELLLHYLKTHRDECTRLNIQSPIYAFSDKEITDFLDFCEDNDLTLFLYTLSELIATSEETRKFRRVVRYANLKNIATSFEYVLKALLDKKGKPLWDKSLNPVLDEVTRNESWINLFRQGGPRDGNLQNLTRVLTLPTQPEGNFWTRNFLLACIARNLTVHHYPTDDWFYGDLFGEMLRAVIYSFLYVWYIAKREHWV